MTNGEDADVSEGHPSDSSDGRVADVSSDDRAYAQLAMDSIVSFFGTADKKMAHRLGNSRTTIAFHLTDCEPIGCTIVLDGEPISASADIDESAEVHVWGSTDTIASVFLGRKHMGLAIIKGEIEYRGPVRKFLRAVPMMRKLDVDELKELATVARERAGRNGDRPPARPVAASPPPPPSDEPRSSGMPPPPPPPPPPGR